MNQKAYGTYGSSAAAGWLVPSWAGVLTGSMRRHSGRSMMPWPRHRRFATLNGQRRMHQPAVQQRDEADEVRAALRGAALAAYLGVVRTSRRRENVTFLPRSHHMASPDALPPLDSR